MQLMNRHITALFCAFLLVLFGCQREPMVPDGSTYSFDLSVWNEDYTDELVLDRVGQVSLTSVENLPSWINKITLDQNLQGGNSVALIDVKSTPELEEKQTATVTLTMRSGATVQLNLVQWPARVEENAAPKSVNKKFEEDWSSVESLKITLSNTVTNGDSETTMEEVRLPWGANSVHHLPVEEIEKMKEHKDDWRMVFNFTGVEKLPGCHYFGLYNRYKGVLRVFYYLHKDDTPESGNDHLWCWETNTLLSEHTAVQFALPYDEQARNDYKTYASQPTLMTPYADRAADLDGGKYLPNQGWWAFDVNMAVARKHDWFSENVGNFASKITLKVYSEDDVMLNSLLKGDLDGKLTGNINLDKLAPKSTSGWGIAGNVIGSIAGGGLGSMYSLQTWFGKAGDGGGLAGWGVTGAFVGAALSVAGKCCESYWKEEPDTGDLGKIDCDVNLDLNATMTTSGIIGGARTNKIPPMTLTMQDFRTTTADGKPTGFSKGVWNLKKHPVVYVVTDAYWNEVDFSVMKTGVQYRIDGQDIYYYQLGGDPDRPGLRVISFLDPTSVEGIYLNEAIFDQEITGIEVNMAYGVYPGADDGYTVAYRKAAGLETKKTWRLSKKTAFTTNRTKDMDFKLIQKDRNDPMFNPTPIDASQAAFVAYRRSEQMIADGKTTRRFYGPSAFYTKEFATPYDIDKVQFVADPQIDVPYSKEERRLLDPMVPDFVVTAVMRVWGKDFADEEEQALVSTLRFVPQIKYIKASQLPTVLSGIDSRKAKMGNVDGKTTSVKVNWPYMEGQINKVKAFNDAIK